MIFISNSVGSINIEIEVKRRTFSPSDPFTLLNEGTPSITTFGIFFLP